MSGPERKVRGMEPPMGEHETRAAELLERSGAEHEARVRELLAASEARLSEAIQSAWSQPAADAVDGAEARAAFLAGWDACAEAYIGGLPTRDEALAIWEAER